MSVLVEFISLLQRKRQKNGINNFLSQQPMTELEELNMIYRQEKINTIITEKKTLKNQFLSSLFNLISKCIENNITVESYIEKVKSIEKNSKWKFNDEDGSLFEVQWIDPNVLANLWIKFDHRYRGNQWIKYYLLSLNRFIRDTCWYRNFKINLLSNKK